MQYLKIRNWDKFQHYKKRSPPWIKLHAELLSDYEFSCLHDASKAHLLLIWLLASQCDNKIPNDPIWIQKKIGSDKRPDIKSLIKGGFLVCEATCYQEASNTLATCISQTEAETEAETEKRYTSSQRDDPVRVPYSKIVDLYHETLPNHPKVKVLTNARKSSIRQRHVNDMDSDLEEWLSYFNLVKRSKFLTGQTQPVNGRKVFIADLEWICKESNFAKIYEGKYHG